MNIQIIDKVEEKINQNSGLSEEQKAFLLSSIEKLAVSKKLYILGLFERREDFMNKMVEFLEKNSGNLSGDLAEIIGDFVSKETE